MRSFTAYLSDPVAVHGPAPLLRQKRAVDAAASRLGGRVGAYVVDSGRRFAGQRTGDALLRLLAALGPGDAVIVESVRRLATDAEAVDVVVGTFALLGVGLVEAAAPGDPDAARAGAACAPTAPAPRRREPAGPASALRHAPRIELVG